MSKPTNDITKRVIAVALALGFALSYTRGGHMKFTRDGSPPVFTSSTPSDHRTLKNCEARLRRVARGLPA